MSGYPPPDPFSGYSQPLPLNSGGNNNPPAQPYPSNNGASFYPSYPPNTQPFPPTNIPSSPSNSSYPYPSQVPHPNPTSNMMSGDNAGYPGYPPAAGYPSSPGYPNSGAVSPAGINHQISPTAPDFSQMEKIPGYERISFDQEIIMPPTLPEWKPDDQERKKVETLSALSEDDVREAAVEYTNEHCCYGSGAAKNMVITGINMMSAFHYKLETFGEKRESAWRYEPYNGQAIDGPMNGPAPRPWDIVSSPPVYFKDGKVKIEVPHTAFVKPCHTCVGNGRVRCEDCNGSGRKQCTWCRGKGMRSNFDNERCTSCEGTGTSRCSWCDATGQVKCKTCAGRGQMKGYVELVITWTNHVDDYISETSSMPKELVRQVTGQVALEEEYPRVYPIMQAPDEAVRNASNEFVNKHNTAFPNERILKQRQCLRLIPIGEVNYQWKDKMGLYYVYGYEHKVYFQNYPQKCCCCTII